MRLKSYFLPLLGALALASCTTPKNIAYFQDIDTKNPMPVASATQIRLEPNDKISIIVNSPDPRLTNLFNLPIIATELGNENVYTRSRGLSGYTIDKDGNIDFPLLGKVNVNGLTREEVAAKIKKELEDKELLNDAIVTVEYQNLGVSVFGEVKAPGRYAIDREDLTILDALSRAGDLTINGMRENVLVTRVEDGERKSYTVNLNSAADIFGSPVYYLKQNDVIYVEPNETQKRASTVNGNNLRSTSFWISVASLLTSVAVLIKK